MDRYAVRYSARFDLGLAEIEAAHVDWGIDQTLAYIRDIVERCERLAIFPKRYATITVNGKTYRSFTHKTHRVFYQVYDHSKTVVIVLIVPGRRDFSKLL